jgi:single-stranded-DNA-specific exonuclease
MAAGFSLTAGQVERFRSFLDAWFSDQGTDADGAHNLDIDLSLAVSGATGRLAGEIGRIGPFGSGNPEPVCAIFGARLAYADVVGQNHVRLKLASAEGARLDGIAFRAADMEWGRALLKARGQSVHVAGYLRSDTWNGRARVQLQLEDAAPAIAS